MGLEGGGRPALHRGEWVSRGRGPNTRQRPGMLLSTTQCAGQSSPQRVVQLQMSTALRRRNPGFGERGEEGETWNEVGEVRQAGQAGCPEDCDGHGAEE